MCPAKTVNKEQPSGRSALHPCEFSSGPGSLGVGGLGLEAAHPSPAPPPPSRVELSTSLINFPLILRVGCDIWEIWARGAQVSRNYADGGAFPAAALDETWSAGLWAEKSYIVINLLCALVETELRPRPTGRRSHGSDRRPSGRCVFGPSVGLNAFCNSKKQLCGVLPTGGATEWHNSIGKLRRPQIWLRNSLYQCFLLQRFPEKLQSLKSPWKLKNNPLWCHEGPVIPQL